jgi:ABC-2 type transport system permease protein
VSRATLTEIGHLAWRSTLRTLRQPIMIVPGTVFPLFLLAINSAGLDVATRLPGFPTDNYLTFAMALTFTQAAFFATNVTGTNIAEDIKTGFFNRLALTPLRGPALIASQLAGVMVLGVIQACTYLLIGLAFGADFAAGIGGVAVLVCLAVMVAVGFGAFGLMVGLRTGSGEAVQGLFPVMFVLLFLSSMALPRNLIKEDWFRTIATYNPISYLIEGTRSLLITGWDGEALALGFGVAVAILVAALAGASAALRTRMVRT